MRAATPTFSSHAGSWASRCNCGDGGRRRDAERRENGGGTGGTAAQRGNGRREELGMARSVEADRVSFMGPVRPSRVVVALQDTSVQRLSPCRCSPHPGSCAQRAPGSPPADRRVPANWGEGLGCDVGEAWPTPSPRRSRATHRPTGARPSEERGTAAVGLSVVSAEQAIPYAVVLPPNRSFPIPPLYLYASYSVLFSFPFSRSFSVSLRLCGDPALSLESLHLPLFQYCHALFLHLRSHTAPCWHDSCT